MAQPGTHYDELEVSASASADTIRAAYRSLMQRVHPDRNPDEPKAVERARRLNIAYEVLSDPKKRAAYDNELRVEAEIARARAAARAQSQGAPRDSSQVAAGDSAHRVNATYGVQDHPARPARNENAPPTGNTRRVADPDPGGRGAASQAGGAPGAANTATAGGTQAPRGREKADQGSARKDARAHASRGRETQHQATSAARERQQPKSAAPRAANPPRRTIDSGARATPPRGTPATASRSRTRSILWPTVIVTGLAATAAAGFLAWDYLEPRGTASPAPRAVVSAGPAADATSPDAQPKSLHLIVTQDCGGFRFRDAPVAYHECMKRKLEELLREDGDTRR